MPQVLVLLVCTIFLPARVVTGSSCFFPLAWHGEYFHLGYSHPLTVVNHTITGKGSCVESVGSQYVMEDREYGERCWRCMSIYRKHHNVLQYKESYCETHFDSLASLCMTIAGDSPMYSLFRRHSEPVKCPLKGPFTFSYSRGGTGSVCSYPRSYLDSCADTRRLQLHFQACIDVQGSESKSAEMACIATWQEGSKSYLVAELQSEHVYSDESRYRCYVYERHGKGERRSIRMAESAAATCNGLWSPTEGFTTFHLEKVAGSSSRCELPAWLTSQHTWSTLDGDINIHINSGEKSFKLKNYQDVLNPEDSHFICHDIVTEDREHIKIVNYVKSDCDSGYVCSLITKTYENVISIEFGEKARIPSEACSDIYFSRSHTKSSLLVSKFHISSSCSLTGRYALTPLVSDLSSLTKCPPASSSSSTAASAAAVEVVSLTAGCGSTNLRIEASCRGGNSSLTEYRCHAHWVEQGETRIVISEAGSSRLLCLSYTERAGSLSSFSCGLAAPQFLISQTGACLQALSSISGAASTQGWSNLVSVLTTLLLLQTLPRGGVV